MTLSEVAKRAGVSAATVSRVLNGRDVVRPEIVERVLYVVRELKYSPNVHASALAGGRRRSLGMVVSNLENPFFLGIFVALEEIADHHGYEVLVENTGYRSDRLVASVRSMLKNRVAGLAVIVSETDNRLLEELRAQTLPVVFYDVGRPARHITHIRVRYAHGMQRLAEYLFALGHRKFGFVGHHTRLAPLEERKKTFRALMREFGSSIEHGAASGADSPDGGRHAARELLDSGLRPTAILCANDYMAIGVLRELRDRGLRVPQDVSVVGFDNIALSSHLCPSLTTIRIPQREIGQMIFEALVTNAGSSAGEICIEPELIVRESSGPAPVPNV